MEVQQPNKWAQSTESRIEMFFDDYLISSTVSGVRESMKVLLFSLFKKGTNNQKAMMLNLILNRCKNLAVMGKASTEFLALVKSILTQSSDFQEYKLGIFEIIFENLNKITNNMIENPNYKFYAFASNLIDFGNNEFKPYLLEANGCLNCFGCTEEQTQFYTKTDSFVDIHQVFTNKLQYSFKRLYEINDISIVLKTVNKFKAVSISYIDFNKEYKLIKKYKAGENILIKDPLQAQGLRFEFQVSFSKRDTTRCLFCGNSEEINCVCNNCPRKSDKIQISGKFKVFGADQQKLSRQLCDDYKRLRENIASIKNAFIKMEEKQKISFNFRTDEMQIIYLRIVNNLKLLKSESPEKSLMKSEKKCFSCNYYQLSSIVSFLKESITDIEYLNLTASHIDNFKQTLKKCISQNMIESIKTDLIEALAKFYLLSKQINYSDEFRVQEKTENIDNNEILISVLKSMKQKKKTETEISQVFHPILTDLFIINRLSIKEKIHLFVCYYLDWEYLEQIDAHSLPTEIKRLSEQEMKQFEVALKFDISKVFNLNLDCYLKAFLRLLPTSLLPEMNLDLIDPEFFHYIGNKVPVITEKNITDNIIKSTRPLIRLDLFNSLPVLIKQLKINESMKLMNKLFQYRDVWNLNIIQASKQFGVKLTQLPAEEQIYQCLQGYHESREYLYIERLHKLFVPERMNFIIRLDPPIEEIERMSFEYPFIPIREVRTDELQGDTIQALHDWVYHELEKMNQAMPLDIIVEKNIIDNMDLPIEVVFERIVENKSKKTIGNKAYDFFRVIYRIQGILGEPKQRSIGNPRDEKLQTCISYSSHFLNRYSEKRKEIGLDVLIEILEEIKPGAESHQKKVLLFEILSTLSLNEALCKKIVQGQYGDSIINATVRLMSFENERDAKITNFLLQLSSKVIDEANQEMINLRKGSTSQVRKLSGFDMDIEGTSDSQNKVRYVLQKFDQCQNNYSKNHNILYRNISKRLIKLLPFCSKDETEASNNLFNFFQVANWASKSAFKMESLLIFMETLSESYVTFKKICKENGITEEIISTILKNVRKEGQKCVDETKLSGNRSIVESALLLLCSLIQGDEELQDYLFKEQIFHNIHEIAQIGPKKAQEIKAGRVPENCYKILKYFSEGKIVDQRISRFLKEKKQLEKKNTEPIKSKKWDRIKNKHKNLSLTHQISEEAQDAIVCSTCQEGYSKRKQILGFYINFTKNEILNSQNWWKQTRKINSFTSTTFFTAIHYECHMRAFQADQKIPIGEWDGALIRNMDVLCNGWIPMKGPKTTNDEFSRVDKKYFERNKGGNFWNVINDLKGLLEKLSIEFDFAKESKGSSYSHNIRYIPVMIGFGTYLIEKNNGQELIEEGIKYFLDNAPKKVSQGLLLATVGLFYMTYNEFIEWKPKIIKVIMDTKKPETNEEDWFNENKKHLIFFKICERIFEVIHKHINQEEEKKVYKKIEDHLQMNMDKIVREFEKVGEQYKNTMLKHTNAQQFI